MIEDEEFPWEDTFVDQLQLRTRESLWNSRGVVSCCGGNRPVATAWQVATGRGTTDAPIRHTSAAAQSGLYQTANARGIRVVRNEAVAIVRQG